MKGAIFNISWNSIGTKIATVSDDRTIRIWTIGSDTHVTLTGHTSRVWKTLFTDKYIVSISEDASCRVWDLETNECVKCWEGHEIINVWSLAIDPTGNTVATGGGDCGIRLWDLGGLRKKNGAEIVEMGNVYLVSFSM